MKKYLSMLVCLLALSQCNYISQGKAVVKDNDELSLNAKNLLKAYRDSDFSLWEELFSDECEVLFNNDTLDKKTMIEGLKQEMQLGERTMLDLLDGEQELLQSELDLALAFKDLFTSYYEIIYHQGKLNAKDLKLSVNIYNVRDNFNKVKN